uniref:Nonstructural protein n=1 Tax=Karimabad virus TaxID=415382 RepID=W8JN33_9VIRU|nr:nonstructural protein [Karimabad virus]
MSTKYMYDKLYVIEEKGQQLKAVYLAHNRFSTHDIAVYDDMEFELVKYKLSREFRSCLHEFYSVGELPHRWGPTMWYSRVTSEELLCFTDLIKELLTLEPQDINGGKFPNVKEALSWPTGHPTLAFLKLVSPSHFSSLNHQKSRAATMILRAGGKSPSLEESIVSLHKKITMEAVIRGFQPNQFPGRNMIKEVASLQCVRLMSGSCFDTVHNLYPSKLLDTLAKYRSIYSRITNKLLGNLKWIPVQDTYFDEPEASIDFDSDDE